MFKQICFFALFSTISFQLFSSELSCKEAALALARNGKFVSAYSAAEKCSASENAIEAIQQKEFETRSSAAKHALDSGKLAQVEVELTTLSSLFGSLSGAATAIGDALSELEAEKDKKMLDRQAYKNAVNDAVEAKRKELQESIDDLTRQVNGAKLASEEKKLCQEKLDTLREAIQKLEENEGLIGALITKICAEVDDILNETKETQPTPNHQAFVEFARTLVSKIVPMVVEKLLNPKKSA